MRLLPGQPSGDDGGRSVCSRTTHNYPELADLTENTHNLARKYVYIYIYLSRFQGKKKGRRN